MGPRLFSRLGRPHPGRGRGAVQPHRLPRGHGLALRQLLHRLGAAPLRLQGRGRQIAEGILDAADFFTGRLPEAFGGYDRAIDQVPGAVPDGLQPAGVVDRCAPAPVLRTLLGLEPIGDHLIVDPVMPIELGHVELLDIPGRWGRIDAFGRGLSDTSRPTRRKS